MTFEEKKERTRAALENGGFMCIEFLNEGIRLVVEEENGKLYGPTFTNEEGVEVMYGYAIDTKGRCIHNNDYNRKRK